MINKNPKLIKYKNFKDSRGLLVPFEIKNKMIKINNSFYFKMKRIFFSAGKKNYYRGDHAHKKRALGPIIIFVKKKANCTV